MVFAWTSQATFSVTAPHPDPAISSHLRPMANIVSRVLRDPPDKRT